MSKDIAVREQPGGLVASQRNDGTLTLEGAEIVFRNFAGKEGMYNAEGDRNFCILLPDDVAEQMKADGWNVKLLKAREEGDDPRPYIQASIKYRDRFGKKVRPPLIFMIIVKNGEPVRVPIDEETIELLDWADIANVDVIIRPYEWSKNGRSGIKAYVKSLFMAINQDYLEAKYDYIPIDHERPDIEEPLALEAGELMPGEDGVYEGELMD